MNTHCPAPKRSRKNEGKPRSTHEVREGRSWRTHCAQRVVFVRRRAQQVPSSAILDRRLHREDVALGLFSSAMLHALHPRLCHISNSVRRAAYSNFPAHTANRGKSPSQDSLGTDEEFTDGVYGIRGEALLAGSSWTNAGTSLLPSPRSCGIGLKVTSKAA